MPDRTLPSTLPAVPQDAESRAWVDALAYAVTGCGTPDQLSAALRADHEALAAELGTDAAQDHPALIAMATALACRIRTDGYDPDAEGLPLDLADLVIREAGKLGAGEA